MLKYIVADDEKMVRIGIKLLVQDMKLPMECIGEAFDGISLIELLKIAKPLICFVDIKMPNMNGIDAIRHGNEISPETNFIILTGFAEFEYAKEAIALNVVDYLLKPIDEDVMLNLYNKISKKLDNEKNTVEYDKLTHEIDDNLHGDLPKQMKDYIDQHYNKDISIAILADRFNITTSYASRIFHKKNGMKFIDYLSTIRINNAKRIMQVNPHLSIKIIGEMVGYYSTRHFTKLFVKIVGCYPSDYKKQIKNR